MIDFILDPLITPAGYYLAGYGLVYIMAVVIAHLGSDEDKRDSYESATHWGWLTGFILHMLAGIVLCGVCIYRALEQSASWGSIIVYSLIYILFVIIDFAFLIAVGKKMSKS